ncbi:MAG: HIT domain-containing protein [Candidatus Cloacimonetes bacterium]|nr:HIT domain-containing protein [Candidatus Cloacimonadota bacterium]
MCELLYSPWRLKYVLSEKDNECILCAKPSEENDKKHLILYRTTLSFVIMNTYPYNNGHLMAVPNNHVPSLNDLSKEKLYDLFETVQLCEKVINKVYSPDGINIGLNLGKAAGAGVDEHLHVHIVPRWSGDVIFMTSTAGTRVIPESFDRAFKMLKEQFDNEKPKK